MGHQHARGSLASLPAIPTKTTRSTRRPRRGDRRAGEVADLDEAHLGQLGQQRMAPFSVARRCTAPPSARPGRPSPRPPAPRWPATTRWRTAGRSRWCRGSRCRRGCRAGRWWSCAPSSRRRDRDDHRDPVSLRSTTSATAWLIIARGVPVDGRAADLEAEAGLGDVPTPAPPSSSRPGSARQRTVAVSCAPWVTSGSSPASLTTTASACGGSTRAGLHREADPLPAGRPTSTACWAARWPARWSPPSPRPTRRCRWSSRCAAPCGRTFAVRGRSGSRSRARRVTVCVPVCRGAGAARRGRSARPGGSRGSGPGGTGASGCRAASAGPTRNSVCFHSLRALDGLSRVPTVHATTSSSGQVAW